jgi:hypothetical protein
MNRNANETESFADNFVASDEYGLFFEVPISSDRETWHYFYGFMLTFLCGM